MPVFSNKKMNSSDSKRHFTIVRGNKEHGLYISSTPFSAAKKAVTKLSASSNGEKVEFSLREITQGSKKKTYGPYVGYVEKLSKPIQLKGRTIENNQVVHLKKREMKGGEGINDIQISLGNCGRKPKFSLHGLFKKCIVLSYKNRKITIIYDEKIKNIIVKFFNKTDTNIYYNKKTYPVIPPNLSIFMDIIKELFNNSEEFFDSEKYTSLNDKYLSLTDRIKTFIKRMPNPDVDFTMISKWLNFEKPSEPTSVPLKSISSPPNKNRQRKLNQNRVTEKIYEEQRILRRAEEAKKERQEKAENLKRLSEWGPTTGQPLFTQKTNYSKKPTYQSFVQNQNETEPNNSR